MSSYLVTKTIQQDINDLFHAFRHVLVVLVLGH